ncbi:Chromosome partition protein Smc [Pandoraea horticolens]|uniref:Chromosome partition protein Smc n=1 Tax=Pandoraea horticolens TaxID=2508298 RepID=A0A5E4XF60_9BURK|nr:DNA-binding protein [Pandoraea horticolens]VVE34788.1 Chromosome partition protein Smc [Pandoraea horticolens]
MTTSQTPKSVMPAPLLRQGGRGISEQDVWMAADTLLMAGQRPTIERIRQQLGRGSPNTVSPYLDAWFAGLGGRLQGGANAVAGLPEGVTMPESVARAALDLWGLALQEGRAALAEEEANRRAALDAHEAELAADREALEQSRAVLHERIASAETAAADARQARDEAQAQARRAEALLIDAQADAVTSRQALASAREAAQALQDEHAAHRANWDAERTRLGERADANERRLMLELDGARESIKSLQQERKQSQRELQEAEAGMAAMSEAQHGMRAAKALQDAVVARLREQVSAQESLTATYQAMLAAAQAGGAAAALDARSALPGRSVRSRRASKIAAPATSILRRSRRV